MKEFIEYVITYKKVFTDCSLHPEPFTVTEDYTFSFDTSKVLTLEDWEILYKWTENEYKKLLGML